MGYFWPIIVLRFVPLFFILAVLIGAIAYPGGNIHDPNQLGYSFTNNFLSDLGGYKSHSSEQNFISSFFFNMSMCFFILVGIAFLFIPKIFENKKPLQKLAFLGSIFLLIGTFLFAGVGLTPYDLYLDLHVFFALNAFRLIVPGCLCYFIVLLLSDIPNRHAFVAGIYLVSVFAYVCYQLFSTGNPFDNYDDMVIQATIQKLIVIISVLSFFSFSFAFEWQIKSLSQSDA